MTRFSRTVSSLSSVSSCGTTPRRPRICGPCVFGSRPITWSVPLVTGETQPIIRNVDVDGVDRGETTEPLGQATGMDERGGGLGVGGGRHGHTEGVGHGWAW